MPLEPEDQRHFNAAEGYLQLGMFLDANGELEAIDPDVRHVPEVLAVRLGIYSGLKKWELMQAVGKKLADYDPGEVQWWISWAYATRRAECIENARRILVDALEQHPNGPIIHYNLACYDAQLGELDSAKEHIKAAIEIHPECRLMALDDEDLKPLWDALSSQVD